MTTYFADTSFYVALANERDLLHRHAMSFLSDDSGRFVTSHFVFLEVANFFRRSAARAIYIQLLRSIQADPDTTVVPLSEDVLARATALFAARLDKDWSLTDCTSFVIMQDRGLTDALTSDHHFEQAGFVPALK